MAIVCWNDAKHFRKGLIASLAQLDALAPTYSPATYSSLQLYQALIPVNLVVSQGEEMLDYFRYGWLLWVALTALMAGLFLPITLLHTRLLIKVNGERRRLAKTSSALRDHQRAEVSGVGSVNPVFDEPSQATTSGERRLRKIKSMARVRIGAVGGMNQYEALIVHSALAFLVSIVRRPCFCPVLPCCAPLTRRGRPSPRSAFGYSSTRPIIGPSSPAPSPPATPARCCQ